MGLFYHGAWFLLALLVPERGRRSYERGAWSPEQGKDVQKLFIPDFAKIACLTLLGQAALCPCYGPLISHAQEN